MAEKIIVKYVQNNVQTERRRSGRGKKRCSGLINELKELRQEAGYTT